MTQTIFPSQFTYIKLQFLKRLLHTEDLTKFRAVLKKNHKSQKLGKNLPEGKNFYLFQKRKYKCFKEKSIGNTVDTKTKGLINT